MEFIIPLLIVGALVLVPVAILFGRRDAGKGPHPEDPAGPPA